MEVISGRGLTCKAIGGVNSVYLMNFVKYSRSLIKIVDSSIIYMPSSDYYIHESSGVTFTEVMGENDGGKFFKQSFSIRLNIQIIDYVGKTFRAMVVDNVGKIRIAGLYNGITCDSMNRVSGSSKGDFNGVELQFSGMEKVNAPFISNLSFLETGYLLQEDGNYVIQEDNSKLKWI